jgi:hypothetical protein
MTAMQSEVAGREQHRGVWQPKRLRELGASVRAEAPTTISCSIHEDDLPFALCLSNGPESIR